jgi:DNA-binding CsgD family transcriptional regulator
MFPGSSSSRWSLADSAFEEQTEAARLASSASKAAVVFRTRREQDALAIPLATGELAGPAPTGVTIVMRERRALSLTARVAEQIWSLTPSEARLAVALADGDSLSSAAVRLGVTLETARNYSKRIYAKMEASGQADVVRRVLTSVAPLAGAV